MSGLFRNLILYPITHLKQSAAPRFQHLLCEVDLLFSHKPFVSQSIINLSHHLNRRRLRERHFLTKAAYYYTLFKPITKYNLFNLLRWQTYYQLPPIPASPLITILKQPTITPVPGYGGSTPAKKKTPTTIFSIVDNCQSPLQLQKLRI